MPPIPETTPPHATAPAPTRDLNSFWRPRQNSGVNTQPGLVSKSTNQDVSLHSPLERKGRG